MSQVQNASGNMQMLLNMVMKFAVEAVVVLAKQCTAF